MYFGRCIKHTHQDKLEQSWCGRKVDESQEWLFASIDHATYNQLHGSVSVCQDCISAIVKTLQEPLCNLTTNAVDTPALHRCGDCGSELQIVRPGKWQCPACH